MTIMARKENIPFSVFWEQYGLKRNRKAAERAWAKLSVKDQWAAFSTITAYREDCQRRGIAMCYAQGYLNGRRWEDELESGDAPAIKPQEESHAEPFEMEKW